MSNKPLINISLNFGNTTVPIISCEDGHKRVPLKPLVDEIGVKWETQREKVQPDKYLGRRLGSYITPVKGGDVLPKMGSPTHLCIRVDRVTAFLNSLNPEKIRGMDNFAAADWLEAKHAEWDDALHAYETSGIAFNKNHVIDPLKANMQMVSIIRVKNHTENKNDRRFLDQLLSTLAKDSGLQYQSDCFDVESPQ